MRFLSLSELLELYDRVIRQSGGTFGVRDLKSVESALAQPRMTFGGKDLYPTVVEKASALGFSLIQNHPFVDGNKRLGHAAMETFLILNGYELEASVDEQEQAILGVASSNLSREQFTTWIARHVKVKQP